MVRSATEASKRPFETKKFFLAEILNTQWPDFYDHLNHPNFLLGIKEYIEKPPAERDNFFTNLQMEKDANKNKKLTDFESILLTHKDDQDLWEFITYNKDTIIISETETKTKIDEESIVAKD